MDKPVIMISSTCFDLTQVRSELDIFIKDMGYESLLSESKNFPINPNVGTIDNCKNKVEIYADIFILIIGGRYGTLDKETQKSITNLEYIEAKRKDIPIYTFVDKKILNYMDIWKYNKTSDYSSVVDSTKVFDFIEQIRYTDSGWTFPFDNINDIRETLKTQLAYLFKLSIYDWMKLNRISISPLYKSLSKEAFQLVINRPRLWEYRLFFQVWLDEINTIQECIYNYKYNISYKPTETLTEDVSVN